MKTYFVYSILLIGIIVFISSCSGIKRGVSSPKVFKSDNISLPYQIYYPEVYGKQKVPVIVFLHGSGERGNDNKKQSVHVVPYLTSSEVQTKFPCVVIAPQCPENLSWSPVERTSWTPKSGDPATLPSKALIEMVSKIKSDKNIYPTRIYLIGLSMGGFGTFDLLSREPSLFAAGAPICGGADLKVLNKYAQTPMWLFHGAKDPVVPVKLSQEAYQAMQEAGFDVRYTEYPEGDHNIWEEAVRQSGFLEWLFNQYQGKNIR